MSSLSELCLSVSCNQLVFFSNSLEFQHYSFISKLWQQNFVKSRIRDTHIDMFPGSDKITVKLILLLKINLRTGHYWGTHMGGRANETHTRPTHESQIKIQKSQNQHCRQETRLLFCSTPMRSYDSIYNFCPVCDSQNSLVNPSAQRVWPCPACLWKFASLQCAQKTSSRELFGDVKLSAPPFCP